jgi:7-carboxy-7-deazaguanine synthase (Cx14CxxC type)
MAYSVKAIFHTLQGEGHNAGRSAVFLRFSGCNLWSGRAEDRARATGSCGAWCDTDFAGTDGPGGGRFTTAGELADSVLACWQTATLAMASAAPFLVCTGGEPMLQLDRPLIDALHARGFEIAVETNGTLVVPDDVDWICVSPKAGSALVQQSGNELKFVFPQLILEPDRLVELRFEHFFLQPMDGPRCEENTRRAVEYCLKNPRWRLSLQLHKGLGLP